MRAEFMITSGYNEAAGHVRATHPFRFVLRFRFRALSPPDASKQLIAASPLRILHSTSFSGVAMKNCSCTGFSSGPGPCTLHFTREGTTVCSRTDSVSGPDPDPSLLFPLFSLFLLAAAAADSGDNFQLNKWLVFYARRTMGPNTSNCALIGQPQWRLSATPYIFYDFGQLFVWETL